jgi:hypothetical protein
MTCTRALLIAALIAAAAIVSGLPGVALAEESYAAIGFAGALPPSTRKFSFHELKKKVQDEVPIDTPAPPSTPESSEIVIDRRIRFPVVAPDNTGPVKETDPASALAHYVKQFQEYEDFKDLVKKLPDGIKAEDIATDLAQLRVYGSTNGTEDLKETLRDLVQHSGKMTKANGELDTAQVDTVLQAFDIERTLRINRAVIDLTQQMAEQARLAHMPVIDSEPDKVASKGR